MEGQMQYSPIKPKLQIGLLLILAIVIERMESFFLKIGFEVIEKCNVMVLTLAFLSALLQK
jgi:hypothetical protein